MSGRDVDWRRGYRARGDVIVEVTEALIERADYDAALAAAFREGQEAMRERAGDVARSWRDVRPVVARDWSATEVAVGMQGVALRINEQIRALPVEDQ